MTPALTEATCANCRFWGAYAPEEGFCRRFPPKVFYAEQLGVDVAYRHKYCETIWPHTKQIDFCGEHSKKDNSNG